MSRSLAKPVGFRMDYVMANAESVAVDADGALIMCDRYGAVWRAVPSSRSPGGYQLDASPLAYLGPGRPLGFHLDHKGDLVVCNAGLVTPPSPTAHRPRHQSKCKCVNYKPSGIKNYSYWV